MSFHKDNFVINEEPEMLERSFRNNINNNDILENSGSKNFRNTFTKFPGTTPIKEFKNYSRGSSLQASPSINNNIDYYYNPLINNDYTNIYMKYGMTKINEPVKLPESDSIFSKIIDILFNW